MQQNPVATIFYQYPLKITCVLLILAALVLEAKKL